MNNLPEVLREFTAFHDRLSQLAAMGGPETDLGPLEAAIHESYHGAYSNTGLAKPKTFDKREGYDPFVAMRKALGSGHTTRMENRTIRMRNEVEAVVFFEHVVVKDGQDVMRNFFVQTYAKVDGAWKLTRETMEQVAP